METADHSAITALNQAIKTWGTTIDPDKGGFLLQDGTFLDMSQGMPFRTMIHRNIGAFFELGIAHIEAMDRLGEVGLIRWVSKAKAVTIRAEPSVEQIRVLSYLVEWHSEKPFHIDVFSKKFGAAGTTFGPETSPVKVIGVIREFYKSGPAVVLAQPYYGASVLQPLKSMAICSGTVDKT